MVAQEYFTKVAIDLGREYISSSEVPDGSSGVLYISLHYRFLMKTTLDFEDDFFVVEKKTCSTSCRCFLLFCKFQSLKLL